MFQEIQPHILDIQYLPKEITPLDYVVILNKNKILMRDVDGVAQVPTFQKIQENYGKEFTQADYLLSIEGRSFFFFDIELKEKTDFRFQNLNVLRTLQPKWLAFATATAAHLANWYLQTRFCGHCGHRLVKGTNERKLVCPSCHAEIFPRISPAIIVGVKKNDQLLLTKYAVGYKRYALIAGFVEVGETLEDTIRREVFEETGLQVNHIQYYKSQPWAFSQSVLMGFFADNVGPDAYTTEEYHSDEAELAMAKWFDRDKLPQDDTTLSLTKTMIEAFRKGEIK
ncbi:NAD(+) diphosphatase [Pediococcus inopinatus]|uniref:NAD(+) diphosphatase n=1 Tax=Pediococcus inopinatus TaxID=114090 RepID=A0ABZ0Q1T4_9LACO|nr:NAD(+) diphosphatase [Pediococcus inopinatus]AVL00006.1 pyrophosphatase [Pediococcus inopinatus]KRN63556.1 pyrophosphatase [Pediococcus inopinatus]WPC19112.1 NAD(+) diphosphatase [Pediococcus inopinatus]WPC20900.1 NAD(+) diphosphatase [Pediococcus inopinatus]WPP10082.1 NAD(+) diphosphatase [Pediococcus inopinatus]